LEKSSKKLSTSAIINAGCHLKKNEFLTFLVCYVKKIAVGICNRAGADATNIQESNSVNHFNLCATIWKVRIFERTPAIRNSGKKVPQIKNDSR
jgi:hypothetical protein